MDAGKAVSAKAPIRAGVPLTGRMVFMVTRTQVFDPEDVLLATADTRIVIREGPDQGAEAQ